MEDFNQFNSILPQLITFLSQHKYEIKGYNGQQIDQIELSDLGISYEENYAVLKGTKTIHDQNKQNVCIKISYSQMQSYEIAKYEASILQDLQHFKSVVQQIEEFDFEDYSVFILITEFYEKISTPHSDMNQDYDQNIANIFYRLIFSLFELHENNYFHGNINSNSIVLDEEGNYKFTNLVSKEYLFDKFDNYTQSIVSDQELQVEKQKDYKKKNYLYTSPEIKKCITKRKTNQIQELLQPLKEADIYNLGLVFLALLGVQINQITLKHIKHSKFDEIIKNVPQNKIKFISLVRNFMINQKSCLRATANQLRKNFFQQYEQVYLFKEQEYEKIKQLIKFYEENKKLTEHYKTYLVCQMLQFEITKNNYRYLLTTKMLFGNLDKMTYENNHFLMHELGLTFYCLKDYKNQVLSCLKALEIRQKIYPKNHQLIAESLKEMGNGYRYIETNCENAYTYKSEALKIYESLYEKEHELVAQTLQSIGSDFILYKKMQKAHQYLTQSFEIREALYVDNHLLIQENISELIKCLSFQSECDFYMSLVLKNLKIKYNLHKKISQDDLFYAQQQILRIQDPKKKLKQNLKLLKFLNTIENCNLQSKADLLQSISFNYLDLKDYEKYLSFGNLSKTLNDQKQ